MTSAELRGCVTMDVGADEFEQSLPLLQELVLGADFVGKERGSGVVSGALWLGEPAKGVVWAGPVGEVRPAGWDTR